MCRSVRSYCLFLEADVSPEREDHVGWRGIQQRALYWTFERSLRSNFASEGIDITFRHSWIDHYLVDHSRPDQSGTHIGRPAHGCHRGDETEAEPLARVRMLVA